MQIEDEEVERIIREVEAIEKGKKSTIVLDLRTNDIMKGGIR